jgi:hypothetical protein
MTAAQKAEEKRAAEIERGRREVILEWSSVELIHERGDLPVYTSTPRMLITGKTVACWGFYLVLTIQVSASSKIRDELQSVLRISLEKASQLAGCLGRYLAAGTTHVIKLRDSCLPYIHELLTNNSD